LTSLFDPPHLHAPESERDEHPVHPPIVRVVANEAGLRPTRLLAIALEPLLRLLLLLPEALDLARVLGLARVEDRLIEPTRLRVVEGLQLEISLSQTEQIVRAAWIAGTHTPDQALEHLHLALEQRERTGLHPLTVTSGG